MYISIIKIKKIKCFRSGKKKTDRAAKESACYDW